MSGTERHAHLFEVWIRTVKPFPHCSITSPDPISSLLYVSHYSANNYMRYVTYLTLQECSIDITHQVIMMIPLISVLHVASYFKSE